jgi:hypothetical protein
MFTIKKYLQYKNTPDGKPRVMTEGVDYQYEDSEYLFKDFRAIEDYLDLIKKEDCRPLSEFNCWTVTFTELDIYQDGDKYLMLYTGFGDLDYSNLFKIGAGGVYGMQVLNGTNLSELATNQTKKLGSFFDDPAKYSKLLWNCTEEEGWEKALKVLGV